jgi:flagellar biosynthesis protein FlhA
VSDENLGARTSATQLTRYPRALGVAAVMLIVFGIIARHAHRTPSSTVGAGRRGHDIPTPCSPGAAASDDARRRRGTDGTGGIAKEKQPPPRTEDLLTIDPLKIELGYGLIAMADPKQGGDLLTRIQIIRQQTATKMGFIVPGHSHRRQHAPQARTNTA